ncbi:MAG: PAS domain S-box protein [Bacteroidota bacterium]|nr:PAS domain S-box protein [Bacteroidota bacterium]
MNESENEKATQKRSETVISIENKRLLEELSQSAANLKAIFDNTSEGFILIDTLCIVKEFNGKAREIISKNHKVKTELQIGKNFFDFIESSRREYLHQMISKVFNGETIVYNRSYCQENNQVVWYRFSINPVKTEGSVVGACISGLDITSQKAAEHEKLAEQEKLKITKERYDVVAKATSDTIWDWDLVNDTTQYNEGILKMFGYKEIEVGISNISGWWDEKLHPDDVKRVTTIVEGFANSEATNLQLEYRFKCADGTYKFILDRAFAIRNESGKAIRMIGAMQDITERTNHLKAIEEQNAKFREIAWTQSHVVRAPLARIMGLIDLIENEPHKNGDTVEILGYIKSSAKELDNVIREIVYKAV